MSDAPAPHLLPWSDDLEHALELEVDEAQAILLDLAAHGIPFYVDEGRETVLASAYVDVWVRAEDVERAQELVNRHETRTLGFDPNGLAPDDEAFDVPDLIDPEAIRRANTLRSLRVARFGALVLGLATLARPVLDATSSGRIGHGSVWVLGVVLLAVAVVLSRLTRRYLPNRATPQP